MRYWLAVCFAIALCGGGVGQTPQGQPADFPPGFFTDGNLYRLADLKGKYVALYFFDKNCPRCRASVPERNALVKALAGKPIKFLAVGADMQPVDAIQYQRATGLQMPIFADTYGIMQARYGMKISLENIWQYRVLNPDGQLALQVFDRELLDKLIDAGKAKANYATSSIDPKFAGLADLFETGQYVAATKSLSAARKTAKKGDLPSLNSLQETFKKEAAEWAEQAESLAASDPVRAYDLSVRVVNLLPLTELAKSVQKNMKALAADKSVKAEVAARASFAKVAQAMVQVTAPTPVLAKAFADVAKKNPNTPTAANAKTLADELGDKAAKTK